ncbi:glutaredoxin [Polyplosphaeria fusca]|uniref:Glutaredoxin n=1 Tax=Polyplosphaeria fusca TaxID=682080 RepID=A0A9P4R8T8_9PLEO|nr:glutaredoxin [Polyplosphaeria fusca]
MPSQRRAKAMSLLVVLAIIVTLYMTSSARQTRTSDFYTKTQEALQVKEYEQAAKQRDADDVGSRLKAAEAAAKKAAEEKGQKYFDSVQGNEKSVAGRVMINQEDGGKKPLQGVATFGGRTRDREAAKNDHETPEEHQVEVELNDILKKSPIIIFSKTFCPHSKQAKHILLDLYNIVPKPYVVELDEHTLGPQLQATLTESTGRRTVPNILVMGKSIGGGDEIVDLHQSGQLDDKLKSLGGARIVEVSLKDSKSNTEMRRRRA